MDSDTLLILFHILDHVSTTDISAPIKIHRHWERFQNPASDQISPRIPIHTLVDAEETVRKFAASVPSAYRLSSNKITLLYLNEELPELDHFLQLKHRLRKLWQETRDLAIWPTARALLNRDAPRAPIAIHGYSGLKFLLKSKVNAIADCLENRFTHHDLCDEHHERRVEATV
jgi:hypothetical protein